jgi:hypothetical protein
MINQSDVPEDREELGRIEYRAGLIPTNIP